MQQLTSGNDFTTMEVPPEELMVQVPHWVPKTRELVPGKWTPIMSGSEIQQAYIQETQKAVRNQDSHSWREWVCTNSLTLSPRKEAAACKAPGSFKKKIHWLILGHVLEGQGSVGTFLQGRKCWWAPIFLNFPST